MLKRLYDVFMTVAGVVLGLALLGRLGWAALHGFEPANEFDRARVADGTYWPGLVFFLGGSAVLLVMSVRGIIIGERARKELLQMKRDALIRRGTPPKPQGRTRRDGT